LKILLIFSIYFYATKLHLKKNRYHFEKNNATLSQKAKIVMKSILVMLAFIGSLFGEVDVAVSIIPQQTFVERIGGDKVNVMTLVQPGQSPHAYEPKPSQMQQLSKVQIYFPITIEFENAWLEKFKSQNSTMQIVPMTKGIQFMMMEKHTHSKNQEKVKTIIKPDSHTWTSPLNVKIMAKNIYETLSLVDPKNKDYYKKNYRDFLQEINTTDQTIREILLDTPSASKFMVFHPAWGYFARDYGLEQFPVEKEGKEPKPKELIALIEKARAANIKAIIVQKEFSEKAVQTIADELHIQVIKESPLASNWEENLIRMANTIANNK
jgi:zinc transport system substrate-binding protein